MSKAFQSVYVTLTRWSYRNFGPGHLPESKSLFNVSFLLIIILTNALLATELLIKMRTATVGTSFANIVLISAVFFMMVSHFILMNNRWLAKLNYQLNRVSKHNLNTWSVVLMVNVIIICSFFIITVK